MKRSDETSKPISNPPASQRPRLGLSPDEAHADVAEILANVAQDEATTTSPVGQTTTTNSEQDDSRSTPEGKEETDEESKSEDERGWLRAPDGGTKHTRVGAEFQCMDLPTPTG